LGELTGRQVDAEKLARYAEDTIKATVGRVATIGPSSRPRVYYARGPRGLVTGLGGSINVETIELLAQNVAGRNQGGLANVSIEQVLLWNPDVIITIDQDFAASVRNDPAWASVKAIRYGRVHLSPKMPFGWVDFPPSVNRLIGLRWLTKILYPDRFPEDIRAQTRDFYAMFYHRTPSDAQIDHVLAGRDLLTRSAFPGIAIASTVLIAGFLLAFTIGCYSVSLAELVNVLFAKLSGHRSDVPSALESVILQVRGPRVLAATLVGAALAVAGTAFQGLFRNPLVS